MTNQRAIILLSQMYLPAFDEEEKDAITKAIEALTAQEPRVLTLDEVEMLGDDGIIYLECRYIVDGRTEVKPAIFQPDNSSPEEDGYYCVVSSWEKSGFYHKDGYNCEWRCWTSQPDEKARVETPWGS